MGKVIEFPTVGGNTGALNTPSANPLDYGIKGADRKPYEGVVSCSIGDEEIVAKFSVDSVTPFSAAGWGLKEMLEQLMGQVLPETFEQITSAKVEVTIKPPK